MTAREHVLESIISLAIAGRDHLCGDPAERHVDLLERALCAVRDGHLDDAAAIVHEAREVLTSSNLAVASEAR